MEQHRIDQSIRLKKLIKALNLNQSLFAKSLGMSQPNINRMVSGGSNISVEVLNRITDRYREVNLHWLLTGEGEMFNTMAQERTAQINEPSGLYGVKGNGRLEDLEERVERLEEMVKGLMKEVKR